MIKDYNDDVKMAEYGRHCAKYKAIREAKEAIRDAAVRLGNATSINEVETYRDEIITSSLNLIEALSIGE